MRGGKDSNKPCPATSIQWSLATTDHNKTQKQGLPARVAGLTSSTAGAVAGACDVPDDVGGVTTGGVEAWATGATGPVVAVVGGATTGGVVVAVGAPATGWVTAVGGVRDTGAGAVVVGMVGSGTDGVVFGDATGAGCGVFTTGCAVAGCCAVNMVRESTGEGVQRVEKCGPGWAEQDNDNALF